MANTEEANVTTLGELIVQWAKAEVQVAEVNPEFQEEIRQLEIELATRRGLLAIAQQEFRDAADKARAEVHAMARAEDIPGAKTWALVGKAEYRKEYEKITYEHVGLDSLLKASKQYAYLAKFRKVAVVAPFLKIELKSVDELRAIMGADATPEAEDDLPF